MQRPLTREGAKLSPNIPPPHAFIKPAVKDFARNRASSMGAALMAKQLTGYLRNADVDHQSRPGASARPHRPQSGKIHRPWKDSVWDTKKGRWCKIDPRFNRQFVPTGSEVSMVVIEPLRDQPTIPGAGEGPSQQDSFGQYTRRPRPSSAPAGGTRRRRTDAALADLGSTCPLEDFMISFTAANRSGGPVKGRMSRPASAPSLRRN